MAQQLGIVHHVFNFGEDFETRVVEPYVAAHAAGRTPNPCVECNRHLKFDRFLHRARRLGFAAVATGHHARVVPDGGRWQLRRGLDGAKDQSYVLSMLGQEQLARVLLPVGELTKDEVRARAGSLGLRTAAKPDSQDVCFVTATGGRRAFLGERIGLRPGRLVDSATGEDVGGVPAVELVTVGQRRGLGDGPGGERRYALSVDVASARVVVGPVHELETEEVRLTSLGWVDEPVVAGRQVEVQSSAHGRPHPAVFRGDGIRFREPERRVAPGQTVVLYEGDRVLGSGIAA